MGIMHKNSTGSGLVNPGASAETVVYTTPAISIGPTGPTVNPIDISGSLDVTTGTGTTAVQVRCRQGTVTGTQVGPTFQHTIAASTRGVLTFGFTDMSAFTEQAGGGAYVITAQQVGGTGAGVSNAIDVKVMILWHPQASSAWPKWSRLVPLPLAGTSRALLPCGLSYGSARRC
jgi:hypothetical protein